MLSACKSARNLSEGSACTLCTKSGVLSGDLGWGFPAPVGCTLGRRESQNSFLKDFKITNRTFSSFASEQPGSCMHRHACTHTLIFYLTCYYENSQPPSEAPGGGGGRCLSHCKGVAITVTCPQFFSVNMGPIQPSFHQQNNWQGNYSTRSDFQSVTTNAENEEEQRVWVRPQEGRNQIIGE